MAEGLRVNILGPLSVCGGRDDASSPSGGLAALLGLLAVHANQTVPRHAIVDALWGEKPPESAVGIIHTYVSRLRSVLGGGREGDASLLARDRDGYRLNLAQEQLDLLVFRRDVVQGRTAWAAGDAARACELLERALGQWRGEPLAGIDVLRRHPAVIALADERAEVVLECADAAAACGRNDQVLPRLRALAAMQPLDEACHARLMAALAGTGRQAEALGVYEELRQRLDEQLGVLPGQVLRDSHRAVLRQDVLPRPESAWLDSARDRWVSMFQLPAAPADFTGRAAGCETIIRAITAGGGSPGVPVVAISGAPGMGKTTVALYAAHMARAQFPDGQLWVQLAGASPRPRDPGDVLGELLRGLGMPGAAIPEEISERAACYRSLLAGRRVLVIADDAATAAQVRPLLPGTAGCAVVVTSRARLEGLEGAHLMPLDVLPADEAAVLLTRIIGEQRVAAEPQAAGELVQACGALPLAVRIAGAKLAARPSWPLSAMVRRMASEHDRLAELEAGDLSVRASIASSYESLPQRPARAFRLLALLGPADFAEWVIGALLGEPDPADVADELAGRSLLTPLGADATGEPRYRLHDLLRDYAAHRLDDEPAAGKSQALERLLRGWLQLAMMADSCLPPEPYFPPSTQKPALGIVPVGTAGRLTADPIAWFTAERVNLLTAVEQACQAGWPDLACELASHQCAFQHLQDRPHDTGHIWRTIGDEADRSADAADGAYARLRIGAALIEHGRAPGARPLFEWCVRAAEKAEEFEVLALALYWRAAAAWDMDDFAQAQSDAEQGVNVARRIGSPLAEYLNLRMLGICLARHGNADRAVRVGEQAVATAVSLGAAPYEVAALHNLAYVYNQIGQYDRAVSVCLRRIDLSRKLGDIRGEALSLAVLGEAYHGLGKYELAAECLRRALPVFRDHHASRLYALGLQKLGCTTDAMGHYAEAIGYLEESLRVFRELRLPGRAEVTQQALDRCLAAAATTS